MVSSITTRPALLDAILQRTERRYRIPATPAPATETTSPADNIALAIEAARRAVAYKETPPAAVRQAFLDALVRLIHDAMLEDEGDPIFQAMVLQHQVPIVHRYAQLASGADEDRRMVLSAVNAIAHPAKQQRAASTEQSRALAGLHESASASSWALLGRTAQQALTLPEVSNDAALLTGVKHILESSALKRLLHIADLEADTQVQHYLALRHRAGPRSGSTDASAQGKASKQRGAAVEAQAAQTLQALASRLDKAQGTRDTYRVVTSLRVPASVLNGAERVKSEWDAVLLMRLNAPADASCWGVQLLCEAKASIDGVTPDLHRLLRGLHVLADAHEGTVYAFETRQGTVHISGASLAALDTKSVLYCCGAPEESAPRLLSAASRMQLLSTQESLNFAAALSKHGNANPQLLEPIWHELLTAPRWKPVLCQYATLHQARELTVNLSDFLAAIEAE